LNSLHPSSESQFFPSILPLSILSIYPPYSPIISSLSIYPPKVNFLHLSSDSELFFIYPSIWNSLHLLFQFLTLSIFSFNYKISPSYFSIHNSLNLLLQF
jgi:hypothetical protein